MRHLRSLLLAIVVTAVSAAAEDTQKLIDLLKSAAPPAQKAVACKRLAIYGTKDAVPVLAPLLADPELASWARIALEAIPDPAADDALREALGKLQGRLLIGTINSIAVRHDSRAVPGLIAKLKDADTDVASAAAVAMGHIGGDASAKALTPFLTSAPAAVRPAVADGCIRLAERSLADGKAADAVKLYDAIRQANVSRQMTVEAIRGVILARPADGIPLLVELLRSGDKKMFNMGLRVTRELPGREAAKALLTELDHSTTERQPYFLLALADRGDAEALPAALKAAESGPTKLRIVAVGVLERLGSPSSLPVLLAAAAEDDAELSQAAKLALTRLPGAEADAAVVSMLKVSEPKTRRLAIDLLTQRRIAGAVPALLKAAQDPDEPVRLASLKALSDLAGIADLPDVLDLLMKSQSQAEIHAAEGAITTICVRSAKPSTGNVVIVKAIYGDLLNGTTADVTRTVAAKMGAGAMTVTASNSDFGDPAGGVVKHLRVDYTVNGVPVTQTVKEGATMTFTVNSTPPACTEALVTALAQAAPQPKMALLRILRSVGGSPALAATRAAAQDPNLEIRETALRNLCEWPTADVLPDLATIVHNPPNPTFKILALRGQLRLIPQQTVSPAQKLTELQAVLALVERPEEKRLALAALGDIPTAESLALVMTEVLDPALKEEASQAAVAIGEKLVGKQPALVRDAMRQVERTSENERIVKRARALVRESK